jgi:6,7-dimethyl-8-ribityllumazine synthase
MWHRQVMDGLVAGALRALSGAGADHQLVWVPGAFELPLAAQWALGGNLRSVDLSRSNHAVIALGAVIRGGTPHFEYVCQAATSGLAQVAMDYAKPVGFGLLTCDNESEALDRAGLPGSHEDKGGEAAQAVMAMLNLS